MSRKKSTKTEKQKKVYKLYVSRTSNELIDRVSDMRFVRITPDYTLIYGSDKNIICDKLQGILYTIIGDKEVERLSSADKDWLMNCNFTIIAEETMKNQDIVLQRMSDALDVLEQELEKHRNTEENPKDEK